MHKVTLKTARNGRKKWLFYIYTLSLTIFSRFPKVIFHNIDFLYLLRDTFPKAPKISCNPQYGSYTKKQLTSIISHNNIYKILKDGPICMM